MPACLIFVYEHMNSGVYAGAAGVESLHIEGRRDAVRRPRGLSTVRGVETVTLLDPRQPAPGRVVHAAGAAEEEAVFRIRWPDQPIERSSSLPKRMASWKHALPVSASSRKTADCSAPPPTPCGCTADKLALAAYSPGSEAAAKCRRRRRSPFHTGDRRARLRSPSWSSRATAPGRWRHFAIDQRR